MNSTLTVGFAMLVSAAFGSASTTASATPPLAASASNAATTVAAQSIQTAETVEQYLRRAFADIPIMVEVAHCESKFRQFDADGNTLRGEQNQHDLGVMQINELYHADEAKKLGFDLNSIEGNVAFARWLYDRQGTDPWISSSKCWGKNKNVAMMIPSANVQHASQATPASLAMSKE